MAGLRGSEGGRNATIFGWCEFDSLGRETGVLENVSRMLSVSIHVVCGLVHAPWKLKHQEFPPERIVPLSAGILKIYLGCRHCVSVWNVGRIGLVAGADDRDNQSNWRNEKASGGSGKPRTLSCFLAMPDRGRNSPRT